MRYLHTMLRVRNLDDALDFYCNKLGLKEVRRRVDEKGRFTLVFLAASEDEPLVAETKKTKGREAPAVELTYNWDTEDYGEARYFGHLAYEVDDIYATCEKLQKGGVTINRPPRAPMAIYPMFVMQALCFALFACAFNLLIGYVGLLSFGHALFFGWASYVSAHAAKEWGLPPELAILAGAATACVLGAIAGAVAIRRQGIYFAMITL